MSEQKSENYEEKLPSELKNRVLLLIVVGLAVYIGLSIYADIKEVGQAFAQFKWVYIPLILLLTIGNYLLRYVKWDYYLRNIGIKLTTKGSLAIFFAGLTFSITPAKMGEVFKSFLLKKLHNIDISKSVPVVFAERATDVLGLVILAAVSFSAFPYGTEVLVVVLAVLVAFIILIQFRGVCLKIISATRFIPVVGKLSDSLGKSYESAYSLFRIKTLVVSVAISGTSWGLECLAMYFVLKGFGLSTSVMLSTFVFSFSSLAGAISMIPGGLIVAEGSFTGLLILAGISKWTAASATIIIRFCTLWFGVMVGLIALFPIRKKLV